MTLSIVQQDNSLNFTGSLNRDTLMLYSPFTLLNNVSGKVQFNMTGLDAIDTAGLAWLIQQLAIAKRYGVSVMLCNVVDTFLLLPSFITSSRSFTYLVNPFHSLSFHFPLI